MKTVKFKIAILSVFTLTLGTIKAQDIHFSAMEYSPLTMNPALAGANQDVQVTANYRTQWNSVATPFQTISAGYNMRFGERRRGSNGFLAAGIHFYNDNAGYNNIATNNLGLSLAYHLKIDDEHSLGLGLQGAFGQRSITLSDAQWGNQYDGSKYVQTMESGENFNNSDFSYFDGSAGLVYTYRQKQRSRYNNGTRVNIGLAAYHLNQPNFSFVRNDGEELYIRLSTFVMAEIGIGDDKLAIEPQLIAQFQGPSLETLLGTDFRFFLDQVKTTTGEYEGASLAIGLFYRNQDALASRFSVRYGGVDIGLAYDFNIFSSLQDVSRARGGVEVFLKVGFNKSPTNRRIRY